MNVQKRAVSLLVAAVTVAGGMSLSASAMPAAPADVTISEARLAVDAVDDVAKVNQDSTVNVNVLGNDVGANLEVVGFAQPQNGEVKQSPEGGLRYTPNSGYNGLDSFVYTVSDGHATDAALVTVTVDPVNNPCQNNLNGLTGEVSFDAIHRTVTYKVVLPNPACSAVTLSGDTYMLPWGHDRSNKLNGTATPAEYNTSARSDVTIARGYRIALTTRPLDVSNKSSKWVMGAIYKGEHQDVLTSEGLGEVVASSTELLPRVHTWRHHSRH